MVAFAVPEETPGPPEQPLEPCQMCPQLDYFSVLMYLECSVPRVAHLGPTRCGDIALLAMQRRISKEEFHRAK